VKTDGLAAGKGVLVTQDLAEAEADLRAKLDGRAFGDAGRTVVVEEGMTGPEVSVFAVCDGTRAVALAPAQDFKRVADGDRGPNTGGMGAYSPLPWLDDGFAEAVVDRFVQPTLHELARRGIDYRGVLYAGLMITPDGPRLVEYNIRFGDPDSQVVLLRLSTDLAALLAGAAAGHIDVEPEYEDEVAVLVVAAAEGYPAEVRSGDPITGLETAREVEGVTVLCAGVAADDDGTLITAGGRVLDVIGRGPDLATARSRAYEAVGHLRWPGAFHRTDIANEVLT
jgi:phosphoribosylamine--glycine ligase